MAKKKSKKPPMDEAAVVVRLNRALSEGLAVRIRRWIPYSARIDGFVVAIGDQWVAIGSEVDLRLNGWHLLRLKDIQSVFVDPDEESLQVRALKARDQWPPVAPPLDLADARSMLSSVAAQARVAAVHVELDRPDICWEGTLLGIDGDTAKWLEVDLRAEWHRKPRLIDLEDITRVDFGGDYETALDMLAGPLPTN